MDIILKYPLVTVNYFEDTHMSNQLIPERLRTARENIGITMAEAARRLNLSKIGYCRYEYGDRTPSPQTVEVIARVFGTSVAYLIGDSEDISPDSIVISKNDAPELFELVQSLSDSDSSVQRRIMAYAKKLSSSLKK